MKLIILIGPPGSGKYTLGKLISTKFDFKLIHNHSIIDKIPKKLNFNSVEFWFFCWNIRFDIIKSAIEKNISGVVMTFALKGNSNEVTNINKLINLINDSGGSVKLVKLNCSLHNLVNRISNKSRLEFNKITSEKELKKWLLDYNDKIIFKGNFELIEFNNNCSIEKTEIELFKLIR